MEITNFDCCHDGSEMLISFVEFAQLLMALLPADLDFIQKVHGRREGAHNLDIASSQRLPRQWIGR